MSVFFYEKIVSEIISFLSEILLNKSQYSRSIILRGVDVGADCSGDQSSRRYRPGRKSKER